jgi:hypothetical protein
MAQQKFQVGAALKRSVYVCIGLAFLAAGLTGWSANGGEVGLSRRAVGIGGGLFFVYCGSMYYFPKYRKRRAELNRLLDEADRELGE